MNRSQKLPYEVTLEVRDTCLCFRLQRAARNMARLFDEALRPFELTHGQYSLMIALNRPEPPTVMNLARFLGMDRTTLTANLKPLERRGLVESQVDPADKRNRRLLLTADAHRVLKKAAPVWRETHRRVDASLSALSQETIRRDLDILASDFSGEN